MTRNEILEVLAELFPGGGYDERWLVFGKRVAKASAMEEREACIQIVQGYDEYSPAYGNHLAGCIEEIRARGQA